MECRAGIGAGDIGEVRRSWGSNMFKQLGKTASTVMLAAGIAVTAGAAPATVTLAAEMTAFDQTTIEQDLAAVDLSVYTENSDGRHALLDDVGFMEYAYSSDSTVAADYFGLYFYVYNPTAREISTRAGANVVNMAVSYDADGEPTEYANCAVTVLDYTDDHLIYKFKLTNSSGAYDRAKAYASAHDGVRRYDIAGIQLWFSGDANATDSNTATEERGITYRCTGYGRGCGADKDAASTLQIDEEKLTTISLDVHQTYYRMRNINQNGANHVNQVTSVYFSIPKKYTQKYGDLFSVKCEWDERRTTPIIVTNNNDIFQDVLSNLGVYFDSDVQAGGDDVEALYEIYDQYVVASGMGGSRFAEWGYNPSNVILVDRTPVGWVFKTSKSNVLEAQITTAQMLNFASDHEWADYLFSDDMDSGRTFGKQEHTFYADEPFDLLTFNSSASGWDKFALGWKQFWSFGKSDYDWGDENTTVDPIKRVTDADVAGTDEENAANLLVHELDYSEFDEYYNKNKLESDIFLLRFAVTDFYSALQSVFDGGWFDWADTSSTYMARGTVFLDFDIIHLGFGDRNNLTIIPVVADPVDIIPGIDPPPVTTDGIDWTLIAILAAVAVACIVGIAFTARKGD